MSSQDVERRNSGFLQRNEADFPEIALSGRDEARTKKYASEFRQDGHVPMTR